MDYFVFSVINHLDIHLYAFICFYFYICNYLFTDLYVHIFNFIYLFNILAELVNLNLKNNDHRRRRHVT